MNFDRITIDGRPYEVMLRPRTEAAARAYARRHGHSFLYQPGRGWAVVRPIDPMTGLAGEGGKP